MFYSFNLGVNYPEDTTHILKDLDSDTSSSYPFCLASVGKVDVVYDWLLSSISVKIPPVGCNLYLPRTGFVTIPFFSLISKPGINWLIWWSSPSDLHRSGLNVTLLAD